MILLIVKQGMTNKIMDFARENLDARGGTFFYGEDLNRSSFLKFLHLEREKREILFSLIPKTREDDYVEKIQTAFHLAYEKNGYGFIANLDFFKGLILPQEGDYQEKKEEDSLDYKALFVVVEKGNADEVCEIANKNGAKGATILHGRGTGAHIAHPLFDMVIEPEKEIVLFLLEKDKVDSVASSIDEKFNFDKPGTGIMFSIDIKRTIGIGE